MRRPDVAVLVLVVLNGNGGDVFAIDKLGVVIAILGDFAICQGIDCSSPGWFGSRRRVQLVGHLPVRAEAGRGRVDSGDFVVVGAGFLEFGGQARPPV